MEGGSPELLDMSLVQYGVEHCRIEKVTDDTIYLSATDFNTLGQKTRKEFLVLAEYVCQKLGGKPRSIVVRSRGER